MPKSKIEWTEATWNPSIGCTKKSAGCKNCYAEVMAKRLMHMGVKGYEEAFKFKIMEERLNQPLKIKKRTVFFVNSMSDLFHEDMPFDYLDKVFNVIEQTPQHTYQILTKRAENMHAYFNGKNIPKNVWLGITVEDKKTKYRIDILRKTNAKIRFLSCEPLLEDLGPLDLRNIHWVIVGGESGVNARVIKKEWVLNIKTQCDQSLDTAFFFKQWGTWGEDNKRRSKKINGNTINGNVYQEYPTL